MPRRSTGIDFKGFARYQRQIIRDHLRRDGEGVVLAGLLLGIARGLDPDNPDHTEKFIVTVAEIATVLRGARSAGAAAKVPHAADCPQAPAL
jgi:hypothetical protein